MKSKLQTLLSLLLVLAMLTQILPAAVFATEDGGAGGDGAPPLHGHRKFLRRADVGIGPYGGDGEADCRVGLRPPRNDRGFLSFRGAKRRGNPFPSQQGSVPHTVVEVL